MVISFRWIPKIYSSFVVDHLLIWRRRFQRDNKILPLALELQLANASALLLYQFINRVFLFMQGHCFQNA
nr:hypothetical protein CFP56_46994 [Quercus suber]